MTTSSNTDSINSSTPLALGPSNAMPSHSNNSQRPSPGHVQTTFNAQPIMAPTSAVSASSMESISQRGSPILSEHTNPSSICASPTLMQPQDDSHTQDDDKVSGLQLGESVMTRTDSRSSVAQSYTGSPNASSEVTSISPSVTPTTASITTPYPTTSTVPKNIIRRLSSRASRLSRRRQSSAAPSSRETSVGPCLWRLRSDSNATAPECSVSTESESEGEDDKGSIFSTIPLLDGTTESLTNSPPGSVIDGSNTMTGPVIHMQLQHDTRFKKISKKNRPKPATLIYDPETNKLSWDRSRPHKFLHVDEIKEIRTESDIQQYARDFGISDNERKRLFSISYVVPDKSKKKFLHLIADNEKAYSMWTTFLYDMLKHRQEVMISLMTFNERAIAKYWQLEMQRHTLQEQQKGLDINGVKRVCQELHIYSSQSTVQSNFRLAAQNKEGLDFSQFLEFVRLMRQRQDIHRIMQSIAAKPKDGLTFDEFLDFLRDDQKEDITNRDAWFKTFSKYVGRHRSDDSGTDEKQENQGNPESGQPGQQEQPEQLEKVERTEKPDLTYMSETAFIAFLCSRQNLPTIDEQQQCTLDRPLNEYFISSSHNTYLLGRQVAGQSSVEGYIAALVRGCRCVEVDCWDGSDGEPMVVHGRTLTSAIKFQDVMTTIQKYAFSKSKFPLWISLEVHCNPTQQEIMADIMTQTFGKQLVTEPLDPDSTKLPSPSELMERILIKVKQPRKAKEETMVGGGRKRGNSLGAAFGRPVNSDASSISTSQSLPQSPQLIASNAGRKFGKSRVNTIAEGEVPDHLANNNSDSDSGSDHGSFKGSNNIVPKLGKLGVYCAGLKFSGFDAPPAKNFNHIFSFMEASFAKHSRTKEEKTQLDIHNMRYLMRVYPDGSRVTSSNFDPLTYWRRGVQMAALNWQTFDLGMQLNRAMFEGGTDSSGYVLKPQELRDIQVLPYDEAVNEALAQGKKERSVVSFNIDVISAQQLMRPANLASNKSMDFYVDVDVFHANDKRNKKYSDFEPNHEPDSPLLRHTEVIRENGFNPMFGNGQFHFKVTTKHPELIFVRWSVRLSSDGENYNNSTKEKPAMASYTAKLTNLKQGYRTLPLLNHAGEQYLFSSLFCKIGIDPIEKKFIDVPRALPDGVSKLNRLGGLFSGRNSSSSPRSTFEKSNPEKRSFESF